MSSIQTEFSVPTSSTPAANTPVRRQPRGQINRRACQKCRHLKIKCDGDAENNVSCSNCDYGTCVYDKSPRKNRQVERLNNKVESLEKTLMETQENVEIIRNDCAKKDFEIEIFKLEKQVMSLLIECSNLFNDYPMMFSQLRQAVDESRCLFILLQLIHTLLLRLSQSDGNDTNAIIEMLKPIVESIMNYYNPNDAFNPNIQDTLNFEEMNTQLLGATNTTPINAVTGGIPTSMTAGMANLTLHSPGSEAGSDMSSLSLPDFKLDLTSPLLTSTSNNTSNIDISPHLTPSIDEVSYFSGSEYGNSPVNPSSDFPYSQPTYLDDEIYSSFSFNVYDVQHSSSYGSNSSNNGQ